MHTLLHIEASGSAGSPLRSLSESSRLAEEEVGLHPSAPGQLLGPGPEAGGHWAPICRRPLLLLSRRLRAPGRKQPEVSGARWDLGFSQNRPLSVPGWVRPASLSLSSHPHGVRTISRTLTPGLTQFLSVRKPYLSASSACPARVPRPGHIPALTERPGC